MSNATLDAIAGGRGQVITLVSIAFPGQTVRVGTAPLTSATGGHFYPTLLSITEQSFVPSGRDGSLPAIETTVEIDDTDRTIAALFSGQYAATVRGSVATVYLATPSVASSSWFTAFAGRVTKVSFPRPLVASVALRVADDQLQRKSRSGWVINRSTWPSAPAESIGKVPPLIYGSHDSIAIQNGPGLAGPAILVDVSAFKYLICAGRAKTQVRVFVDGVKVASPPAFAYETRNGRDYTTMTFSSDQGSSVITCDLDGLEDVGDGTGAVIQNGMTQLAHKLSNFILGDWKSGAWLSTSSLIDSSSLTAPSAFFTARAPYATDYAATQETGLQAIAKFCAAWPMSARWTYAGQLAFRFKHANVFAAPYTGSRVRWYRDETAPLSLDQDDFNLANRLLVSMTPSASQARYLTSFEVMDAGATSEATGDVSLAHGEAR